MFADYEINTRQMPEKYQAMVTLLRDHAGGYGVSQQNPGDISRALREAGFVDVSEDDWTEHVMPTYNRLRKIARPFAWITPRSWLAPYCVNTVMASHGYSSLYEDGYFRYLIYRARVADVV